MKAQAEKVSKNRVALTIEVDADEVDAALERAYRKVVREINVPGFRKGKVPRRIIEARFGVEVLYEDALDELIPRAYQEAVTAENLEVIDEPSFSDVHIEPGTPLRFRAEVDVMPEAELGEYKGLKAEKLVEKVEESDIDHMLEHLQDEQAQLVAVERTQVEDGDFVTIDFEGYIDGEPFEGGAAKGYTLQIGSGRFIDGFEEQLIGAEVGSEVEVNTTFPEDYGAEDLAGKDVLFKVTVHSIRVREVPELDDDFARDVSDAESLAELREQIRKEMEEEALERAEQEMRSKLIDQVVKATDVEAPKVFVDQEIDRIVDEFALSLIYQGINPQTYLEQTEQTVDDLRERFREEAEQRVKGFLTLRAIAQREGITVSPEEIQAHIDRLIAESDDPERTRRDWKDSDRLERLENQLTLDKAIDFLVEHADVEVKEIPSQGHGHHHHHHPDEDDHAHDHEHGHGHDHADDTDEHHDADDAPQGDAGDEEAATHDDATQGTTSA